MSISRQRLVEFTVVVLGVLVALGLENLVQEARYRADARALERAFVADLKTVVDLAIERQVMAPCHAKTLRSLAESVSGADSELLAAADVGSSNSLNYSTSQVYDPPLRVWTVTSFDRALNSEAFKRISEKKVSEFAIIFSAIDDLSELNSAEYISAGGLAPLGYRETRINDEIRSDILKNISTLDRLNSMITFGSLQIIESIISLPEFGEEIRLDAVQDEELQARLLLTKLRYGNCVGLDVYDRLKAPATL